MKRAIPLLAFALGALCVLAVDRAKAPIAPCYDEYDLLNPSLPCEGTDKKDAWDFDPLRDALAAKIAEHKAAGRVEEVSVYFRDLSPGPRFRVGEYDKFHPASLTKLPILIAYLHQADNNPELLDATLTFSGALNTNFNVESPEETIQPGGTYTIRELLYKMIVYSDNYSYVLLTEALNEPSPLSAYYTFRDLGVLEMMFAPDADFVSIQSYGNLFGILYNTGYLSKEMSQFALDLLSLTTFEEGIVDGVPEGVRVAHKFGNRNLEGGVTQLHDCGIVYHPKAAYILCVMTSGRDLAAEKSMIAEVSRMVYQEVSSIADIDQ